MAQDVPFEEEVREENEHGTHVHHHQDLGEVRRAARGAFVEGKGGLEEDGGELKNLEGGEVRRPPRRQAEARAEIMHVNGNVTQGVGEDGEVPKGGREGGREGGRGGRNGDRERGENVRPL